VYRREPKHNGVVQLEFESGSVSSSCPIVIELGVLGHDDEGEFGSDASGRPRPNPWLVVLLILACCTAGVTAAAQPAAAARLVFSAAGVVDSPQVAGDNLLATVDGPTGTQVTAYDLATGRVRWEYLPPRRMLVQPAGDTVIIAPVSCSLRAPFNTYGVDAASGRRMWEIRGAPLWLVVGAPIVVIKQTERCAEATLGFDAQPGTKATWIGLDVASGEKRWDIEVEPGVNLAVGVNSGGRASWLTIADDGVMTSYDLTTGRDVGRYEVPEADRTDRSATPARIMGAGGQMLSVVSTRAGYTVTAHEIPGLRPRWTSAMPPPRTNRIDLDGVSARECGPVICLGPAVETIGLDRDTGTERWRVPGRPLRVGAGHGLFMKAPPVADVPTFVVHDLATGATGSELRDTDLLNRTSGDPLLRRSDQPEGEGGRLWQLDLAAGTFKTVTVLPGPYANCDAGGRYLACRNSDGQLQVWRLPVDCSPSCGGRAAVAMTSIRFPWQRS
jgi:outer membrane protein assembly factor BamB